MGRLLHAVLAGGVMAGHARVHQCITNRANGRRPLATAPPPLPIVMLAQAGVR